MYPSDFLSHSDFLLCTYILSFIDFMSPSYFLFISDYLSLIDFMSPSYFFCMQVVFSLSPLKMTENAIYVRV